MLSTVLNQISGFGEFLIVEALLFARLKEPGSANGAGWLPWQASPGLRAYNKSTPTKFSQHRFDRRASVKKYIALMCGNICTLALSSLLFLLLIGAVEAQESGAGASAVEEVVTPNFRMSLPVPIKVSTEKNVLTPWGRATETRYAACVAVGNDKYGECYGFSDFAFSRSRPLPVNKLKQARSFFLQAKKCFANDKVSRPIWKDARGKPWPQTLFGGGCAAPENFLVLTAIANGHVYRVHVSQNWGPHTTSLQGGLTWMIEHIQLTEK